MVRFMYAVEPNGSVYVWDDYDGEDGGSTFTATEFAGFKVVAETLGYDVDETAREYDEAEDEPEEEIDYNDEDE